MMSMTNYMELLMVNQPWNLILFMVIPVGLAEALVATEFYAAYLQERASRWHVWNRRLGIAAGTYFTGVFFYLIIHVVPYLSWRGPLDVLAVVFYLSGIVPLLGIALLELGVWGRGQTQRQRIFCHFKLLFGFLVVSHAAMIFGMTDPALSGHGMQPGNGMRHEMGGMPAMEHGAMDHSKMNHGEMNRQP